MNFEKRWQKIEQIGEGGQGVVFRVLDREKFDFENTILKKIQKGISGLSTIQYADSQKSSFELFRQGIIDVIKAEDQNQQGALKILHEPKDAREVKLAAERIKKEIKAMQGISHPNLLRILDADPDEKWFVSPYFPKGTLANNLNIYKGNFIEALKAFCPVVEGVAELHRQRQVHRDIKPQNIFIDSNNHLVLGDFGLLHFIDQQHTRISETWDNVGSRDWQPGWSMGIRIEEIKPTFDVFCLGKVLWSMVSGLPKLQLWYYDDPKFNVEEMFTNARYIDHAKYLFSKCIVQYEKDCLPDALSLLFEIDKILLIADVNADRIRQDVKRRCKVCGIGLYEEIIDRNASDLRNFGLNPDGSVTFKVFVCDHCGNVQLFTFDPNAHEDPPAWFKS